MAQQIIDTTTDHGTYKGDPAKTAFEKANANFTENYAGIAAATATANAALPRTGGNLTGALNVSVNMGMTVAATSFAAIALRATGTNGREYRLVSTDDGNGLGGSQFILYNQTNSTVVNRCDFSYNFLPGGDNNRSLGSLAARWSVVYAGTGTINTSDAREKTAVRPLVAAEKRAGLALARELGGFHFLGFTNMDTTIEHIGMTVQRAIEIMEAEGLDTENYAFIVHDSWPASPAVTWQTDPEYDLEGNLIKPSEVIVIEPPKPAGDRYGFRMDQLTAFIARAIVQWIDDAAARLDALEQAAA